MSSQSVAPKTPPSAQSSPPPAVHQTALQTALRTRLESLRIRYPSYSVRAFAKKAGISPATLSLVLQGKRTVSRKLALLLSERLMFDPQERAEIITGPKIKLPSKSGPPAYVQLTQDQYELISDWRAFAVLNLMKTVGFKGQGEWIAKRLGITVLEAKETLARLKRLQMIRTGQGGKLTRVQSKYRTTEDIANLSLRKSHHQTLDLAYKSLENDAVEMRDFSWITLPVNSKKMQQAKTLIRKFQDDFAEVVEDDVELNEVYRLAVQFFPLSKVRSGQS